VTHVAGLDSRGFLFGSIVASAAGLPFVPLRKAGKLPGKCLSESYALEYGEATLEVQVEAVEKDAVFVVFDDLLATGGTMGAAVKLLQAAGAEVLCGLVTIALPDLGGAANVPVPVMTVANISGAEASARAAK
jgi:adenine phosphoribosyltransferase